MDSGPGNSRENTPIGSDTAVGQGAKGAEEMGHGTAAVAQQGRCHQEREAQQSWRSKRRGESEQEGLGFAYENQERPSLVESTRVGNSSPMLPPRRPLKTASVELRGSYFSGCNLRRHLDRCRYKVGRHCNAGGFLCKNTRAQIGRS